MNLHSAALRLGVVVDQLHEAALEQRACYEALIDATVRHFGFNDTQLDDAYDAIIAAVGEAQKPYVTKTGRVLTEADIEELADEAEHGYDVNMMKPRRKGST